jgi:uncharacterized membrane protein YjjP (DUF1212 family)
MSALVISEVPRTLLDISVVIYLIGFGVYILCSGLNILAGSGEDNCSVFVFFASTVAFCEAC